MSETKWIDWHPKVGDVRPGVYRVKDKRMESSWLLGRFPGSEVAQGDIGSTDYQIPAPEPKETSMKYWQPRVEPMAKGWTLEDVPSGVLCKCGTYGKERFLMRSQYMEVWEDHALTDLKPSECRVIRVIDPIPAGAMTLDKVPEGVRCVVDDRKSDCIIRKRVGEYSCSVRGHQFLLARDYQVLHILDTLPELTYTLDTLPVGRVIEQDKWLWFKDHEGDLLSWHGNKHGLIVFEGKELTLDEFRPWQVTDIIMELKEVGSAAHID